MTSKHKRLPLVPEFEASYYASLAKTVALCQSLKQAHSKSQWRGGGTDASHDAAVGSKSCYSKKLRESIMFATCGSYEAARIPVPEPVQLQPLSKTRGDAYVDKYVDTWTIKGTPHMWQSERWQRTVSPQPKIGLRRGAKINTGSPKRSPSRTLTSPMSWRQSTPNKMV